MNDLNNGFRLPADEEISRLLALNREDEISDAQLARLDALLNERGIEIEDHIHALHYPNTDKCAA
jgi:hypothetical protein